MKKKKYTDCSVDDLLEDHEFVSLVIRTKGNAEWDEFLLANRNAEEVILRAQEFILSFRVNDAGIKELKRQEIWKNVETFRQQNVGKSRIFWLKNVRKVAAVLALAFSIGGLSYFFLSRPEATYRFSDASIINGTSNPRLVLSNGKGIDLGSTKAQVEVVRGKDALAINRDSIVQNTPVNIKGNTAKLNEIITPFGKKSSVVLADGTLVHLNAGSRFAFPQKFDGKSREVFLDGEGFFEVQKDHEHPFIVHSEKLNLEVFGTKFNISTYRTDDFARVVLIEGSVAVWKDKGLFSSKAMMTPGQKATLNEDHQTLVVEADLDPAASYAWIDGYYSFNNERFDQILKKLERYYNVRFNRNSEMLQGILPVSGKLDLKESLLQVLTVLAPVAKFDYRINGNEILIEKK